MVTISSKKDIDFPIEVTETRASSKRARLNDASVSHLVCLKIARKIWKKDPDKIRSE